jgi:hypothetical protein
VGDDNHPHAVACELLHEFVLGGREIGAPLVGSAQCRMSRVDTRLMLVACLIAKYETS